MTLFNPSLRGSRVEHASAQAHSQPITSQIQKARKSVQGLIDFVLAEHLTVGTFRASWRHDDRAVRTLRAVGRSLQVDLVELATSVQEILNRAGTMPLPDYQAREAAHLFSVIDSVEPDEVNVGDGRSAAEKFQYAAEARSALLRYSLSVLSQRYPAASFGTLAEAAAWTAAFSAIIEEAEQVIQGTQQLLCDEATAIQSYLDTLYNRFELLEEQARAAALPLRHDWRSLLEQSESRVLGHLSQRHAQLEGMAFGELKEARDSGWLEVVAWQTARHAPVLGSLLLTLAGGAALMHPDTRAAMPPLSLSGVVQEGLDEAVQAISNFPVVARRYETSAVNAIRGTNEEVSAFFSMQPRPRGRQTLTLRDSGELTAVLDELAKHGYERADVLKLLGIPSVEALKSAVSLDLRWSQGGRPLLLPPYEAATTSVTTSPTLSLSAQSQGDETATSALHVAALAHTATAPAVRFEGEARPLYSMLVHQVEAMDTLSALAERYDTTIAELMGDNRLGGDTLQPGQLLLIRAAQSAVAQTSRLDAGNVTSGGSFPSSRVPLAVEAPTSMITGDALIAHYGSTLFPSVDEMPDDVRGYFTTNVQAVADFFNVRPGDIIGILQAENNNAGLRIHQPATSSAGAKGVAQVIARTWNGWASPETERHTTDLRAIEQYGGLGFDWSMRDEWRAWKDGESDGEALSRANADPNKFENSVAAVARHLVHWGLTRERSTSDPVWFQQRLADSISVYNSGRVLSEAENFTQSSQNQKTTGQYVREAIAIAEATPANLLAPAMPAASTPLRESFQQLMQQTMGVKLSEQEVSMTIDGSAIARDVGSGTLTPEDGASQLLEQTLQHYVAEGRAARAAGEPLPWPFVHDNQTLAAQKISVRFLGRPLSAWELENVVAQTKGDEEAVTRLLASRGDARLFAGTQRLLDTTLKRTERGLAVTNIEVAALVQTATTGHNPFSMSESDLQSAMTEIEQRIQRMPEYQEVHQISGFTATPLVPMPRMLRAFGVAVNYQQGGVHTGIDIANPRVNNQEPLIFAVAAGTVAHVGPLYCDASDACRGGNSIVLDHGNQVYSIYSHNSAASVQPGQRVAAGEPIGRQGDEGYSFGSHLHFEVHTGAPFSGNWQQPFEGGQFEDPLDWLPQQ